jgi:hypothetical protein
MVTVEQALEAVFDLGLVLDEAATMVDQAP